LVLEKLGRLGLILFGAGVALLGEHIYYWGCSFSMPPWTDHGFYGLILIVMSVILLAKKEED